MPISHQTRTRLPLSSFKSPLRRPQSRGFTLVEVLLVITLLGLLATSVVPRITNVFQLSLNSSVRRFGALVKFAFDQSVLTGRTHRIVLDLDRQEWLIEQASAEGVLAEGIRAEREADYKRDLDKLEKLSSFNRLKNSLVDKMPSGVEIISAESTRFKRIDASNREKELGKFYIYAFPTGFIDEATVILSEAGRGDVNQFKISTKSLTGKVEIEGQTARRGGS